MTQALLTNTNSLWGVIINPNSSNTYRHALSFATEDLKHQYISKNLFGGTDYRTLFDTAPKIGFAITSASSAIAKIDIKDYPNETQQSLANKDFMIIKENGKYWYYAITKADIVNMSIVHFTLELDIFFQYDVKDMFNNAPVMLERAMIDRFKKEPQTGAIHPSYLTLENGKYVNKGDSQMFYHEPLEITDENLVPNTEIEYMQEQIKKYIDPDIPVSRHAEIIERISSSKWSVIYKSINDDGNIDQVSLVDSDKLAHSYLKNGVNKGATTLLPYSIFVAPETYFENEQQNQLKVIYCHYSGNSLNDEHITPERIDTFGKVFLDKPNTITNTHTISPFAIFRHFKPENIKIGIDNTNTELQIIFHSKKGVNDELDEGHIVNFHLKDSNHNHKHILIRSLSRNIENIPLSETFSMKPFIEKNTQDLHISQKVKDINHKYELKADLAPFRKLYLRCATKLEKPLIPQSFKYNEIIMKYGFSFVPELWNIIVNVENYNNLNLDARIKSELEEFFEDVAPYSLPSEQSAYQEYVTSHKSQMTAGLFANVPNTALGVAGGMIVGNPLAIAGSIGSAISNINQNIALQKDLARTPLKLSQTSSVLVRDHTMKNMKPVVFAKSLPKYLDLHIRQFLYTWGYALNMYQDDINKYLDSRYYFNFIQVPQTFENNKLQASAEIKQIINDTIAEGLTIWHVRDLNTFKGIKNYEYENVEMSLL